MSLHLQSFHINQSYPSLLDSPSVLLGASSLQPTMVGLAGRFGHACSMFTAYGVHISANWRT